MDETSEDIRVINLNPNTLHTVFQRYIQEDTSESIPKRLDQILVVDLAFGIQTEKDTFI